MNSGEVGKDAGMREEKGEKVLRRREGRTMLDICKIRIKGHTVKEGKGEEEARG